MEEQANPTTQLQEDYGEKKPTKQLFTFPDKEIVNILI